MVRLRTPTQALFLQITILTKLSFFRSLTNLFYHRNFGGFNSSEVPCVIIIYVYTLIPFIFIVFYCLFSAIIT